MRDQLPKEKKSISKETNLISKETNLVPEETNLVSKETNLVPEEKIHGACALLFYLYLKTIFCEIIIILPLQRHLSECWPCIKLIIPFVITRRESEVNPIGWIVPPGTLLNLNAAEFNWT